MDDIQTILYIVIGVIYLLFRVLRKKSPKLPPPDTQEDVDVAPQAQPKKQPHSFEELLREITGKSQKPQTEAEEKELEEFESEPQVEAQRSRPLISDQSAQATFKESVKEAEKRRMPVLDVKPLKSKLGIPQEYLPDKDAKNSLAREIASSLGNTRDIKKAIVINEILTRKYN